MYREVINSKSIYIYKNPIIFNFYSIFLKNSVDAARRRRAVAHSLSSKDMVLSHAVEGFIDLTDYGNDAVLSRY